MGIKREPADERVEGEKDRENGRIEPACFTASGNVWQGVLLSTPGGGRRPRGASSLRPQAQQSGKLAGFGGPNGGSPWKDGEEARRSLRDDS